MQLLQVIHLKQLLQGLVRRGSNWHLTGCALGQVSKKEVKYNIPHVVDRIACFSVISFNQVLLLIRLNRPR